MIKKINKKYYFSVEGETEKWYLEWLETQINENVDAKCTVTFDCPIQKNPLKRVKSLVVTGKIEITHIFDYESNDEVHTKEFLETLDNMKKAESLGKQIKYLLGYSNFTFELWIILHKKKLNSPITHRKDYIKPINSIFNEKFENLVAYKHELKFKKLLSIMTLEDVKHAINAAKNIKKMNEDNGLCLQQYRKYRYYKENPSLSIGESIEKILKDCGLVK